ncbi:MAG: hypothetical protein ACSHXD_08845 [Marinosulfonomonas sp.]
MLKLIGLYHPFFRPLMRRLLTMAVIAAWGLLEFTLGNTGWAAFGVFLLILCLLAFFIFPDPQIHEDDDV